MSSRAKTLYVCSSCGSESAKWQGQCPACGEWNTLSRLSVPAAGAKRAGARPAGATAAAVLGAEAAEEAERLPTGSGEFDRVLGGGLVAGSVTLLGGDPGIGKSTLLLQAAAALARSVPVLYATGEESLRQVGLRARRLGVGQAPLGLLAASEVGALMRNGESSRAPAIAKVKL